MALTAKQQRFVEEYLIDLNATQAAIRTGYSEKTAYAQGQRLLKHVEVAAAVAAGQKDHAERADVTVERIVSEMAAMAFYDPADIAGQAMRGPQDIPSLPEHVRRAIVGWGWDKAGNFTLKLAPKQTALEQLGKHLGIFIDRHEHSGKGGGPVRFVVEE